MKENPVFSGSDRSGVEEDEERTGNHERETENSDGYVERESENEALSEGEAEEFLSDQFLSELEAPNDFLARLEAHERLVRVAFDDCRDPDAVISCLLNLMWDHLQAMNMRLWHFNIGIPVHIFHDQIQDFFYWNEICCIIAGAFIFNLRLRLEDLKIERLEQTGLRNQLLENSLVPYILHPIKESAIQVKDCVQKLRQLVIFKKQLLKDHRTKYGSELSKCEPEVQVYHKSGCVDDKPNYLIQLCWEEHHNGIPTVEENFRTSETLACRYQTNCLGEYYTLEELIRSEKEEVEEAASHINENSLLEPFENFDRFLTPYMNRVLVLCDFLLDLIQREIIDENVFLQKMKFARFEADLVVAGEEENKSKQDEVINRRKMQIEEAKQEALRKKEFLEKQKADIIEKYKRQIAKVASALEKLKTKRNGEDQPKE